MLCPGATLSELYINLRRLLLVLGLEIPRQSQVVNLWCLLLLLGLGLTEASCCLFERIYKIVKHKPRPVTYGKAAWVGI